MVNEFPSHIVEVAAPDESTTPYQAAAAVASRQHGFILRRQLLTCGLSGSSIARAVAAGRLVRAHQDLYEMPGLPATWIRDLAASMFAVGPPVFAARGTALALEGVRRFRRAGTKHLLVPYGRDARFDAGDTVVHRSRTLTVEDVTLVDGVPATVVTRSVCDLSNDRSNAFVRWLLSEVFRSGAATFDEMWDQLGRMGRIPGKGRLKVELARLDPQVSRSRSAGEFDLFELGKKAGLPDLQMNHAIRDDLGRIVFEIDVAIVALRLGFEFDDDGFHLTPDELVKDRHRDNNLRLKFGWDIYRFSRRVVEDHPDIVRRQMVQAYERAVQSNSPVA